MTIKRRVTLPNGRKCGLGVYVAAWKTLLSADPESRVSGFGHFPEDAQSVLRQMRRGLHDRINKHVTGHGEGRKWSSDWQRQTLQTARAVNTPRLIVRWVPQEFRARLAERLEGAK